MFGSVEESLRADIAWLKSQSTVRKDLQPCIRGLMYDLKTGKLREVQ